MEARKQIQNLFHLLLTRENEVVLAPIREEEFQSEADNGVAPHVDLFQ